MSGPIVRKYGFPNFENIFGKRELEHGVEEQETPAAADSASSTEAAPTDSPAKKGKQKAPKTK
jgi:hypothetical protein